LIIATIEIENVS